MEGEEEFGRRLLFEFFIHEAENLHNRVDWFLIFHGILFEAFLSTRYAVHRITLGTLGCLVSYVWLVAGIRQLWNLRHLVNSVKDRDIMGSAADIFNQMYRSRGECQPRWMKWASATPAFCILLPAVVLLAWLVVTTTYAEVGAGRGWPALVILVAIALLTVSWRFLKGPNPPAVAIAALRDKIRGGK